MASQIRGTFPTQWCSLGWKQTVGFIASDGPDFSSLSDVSGRPTFSRSRVRVRHDQLVSTEEWPFIDRQDRVVTQFFTGQILGQCWTNIETKRKHNKQWRRHGPWRISFLLDLFVGIHEFRVALFSSHLIRLQAHESLATDWTSEARSVRRVDVGPVDSLSRFDMCWSTRRGSMAVEPPSRGSRWAVGCMEVTCDASDAWRRTGWRKKHRQGAQPLWPRQPSWREDVKNNWNTLLLEMVGTVLFCNVFAWFVSCTVQIDSPCTETTEINRGLRDGSSLFLQYPLPLCTYPCETAWSPLHRSLTRRLTRSPLR